MIEALLVFAGGGLGAVVRYYLSAFSMKTFGMAFPWGTFFINVTGSLVMGLAIAWLASHEPGPTKAFRLFFTTGVLGGYTTFSTFSLDSFYLWERGEIGLAAAYVAGSVVLSLLAVAGGMGAGRLMFH
ncbi:fluoride efflux transporter CrcB [Pseudoxanthobacter sp.]|uniref:fluoride efflux transporter CrcB n=1 Tax=Pseudoxanthobacter sp. TaxID=1925742 RepID=UPI002FE116F1